MRRGGGGEWKDAAGWNHIFWQVMVWPLAAKPAEWVVCEGPISRDVLQKGGKKPTTVTGEATAAM